MRKKVIKLLFNPYYRYPIAIGSTIIGLLGCVLPVIPGFLFLVFGLYLLMFKKANIFLAKCYLSYLSSKKKFLWILLGIAIVIIIVALSFFPLFLA